MQNEIYQPNKGEPLPHGPTPTKRQYAWHQREMFGFVHFSINTFTDREWGFGDESPSDFHPTELDCEQWVEVAKQAGFKGLILTAKHHDGFCLWPTKTTEHSVRTSSFANGCADVVGNLANACRTGRIDFGVYCSPWDRNHADYGGKAYVDAYHEQWRELLTQYGPLFECWFDGANGGDGYYGGACETRSIDASIYYKYDALWSMCRKHQPNAVLFSDVGPDVRWCANEMGMTTANGWSKVSDENDAPGKISDFSKLAQGDANGSVWRGVECDVSIRPGWFWHPKEAPKTADQLFEIWLSSVGRGACLNLNITPDRKGRVPTSDILALRGFSHKVKAFTGCDLAFSKPVEASGTAYGDANHLTDGNEDTYWAANSNIADLVIRLGQKERIGGIRLEEAIRFGQRVSSYAVDIGYGGLWYEVTRGSTIGPRSILRLAAIEANAIRIRILQSCAPAVLSRVCAYAGG